MFGNSKIVDLRNTHVYHGEYPVLKNITFELIEAEFCYVIGKSGSGKTTLLKALYGESIIKSGKAQILDFDLISLTQKEIPLLRRKIGMVFQDFHLLVKWTTKENLDFVLRATEWKDPQEREHRIQEVLKRVHLLHRIDQPVYTLSGGEQQRVALARALLNRPSILIADEPTGSLDPFTSDQILYLIAEVASENKMGVLFATHDQRILNKFPARVFECADRSLVEIG